MASHHFTREKQGRLRIAKVYSEVASAQAEESNGERRVRLPQCTVVVGQIDLNTGGVVGDPVEKANPLE
jgi:hypothetical protein